MPLDSAIRWLAFAAILMGGASATATEYKLLPQVLRTEAEAAKCEDFSSWYAEAEVIDPPYLFGWLAGPKKESAAFWCLLKYAGTDGPRETMQLVLVGKGNRCPSVLRFDGWGGRFPISVVRSQNIRLNDYYYFDAPSKRGPAKTVPNARLLRIGNAGEGGQLFCYEGKWLIQVYH